jgi:HAD superfamily hydrolase (TIGR01549 family)
MLKNKKAIIYDLDGTIIVTIKLNEDAWIYAANKLNLKINKKFLDYQRGIGNLEAALYVLGENSDKLDEFINIKKEYFYSHLHKINIFKDFLEAKGKLEKNYNLAICTSSSSRLVNLLKKQLSIFNDFKVFVSRDDTFLGKPNPEPLLKTISFLNLEIKDCIYVGDAYTDYLACKQINLDFVYYNLDEAYTEMPKEILRIKNHNDLLKYL